VKLIIEKVVVNLMEMKKTNGDIAAIMMKEVVVR
jgi:hypothetical protein